MRHFYYNIFDLHIISELEIPEAPERQFQDENEPDVTITFGNVPDHLENVTSSGVLFETSGKIFLLNLPRIGKFLATEGRKIIIDPIESAEADEIRLFLLGSVLGAILHQRGILPIHGSASKINDKAVLIIGNSAAGKSTLAASLVKKGFSLISDDLSAVSADSSGLCRIHAGIPSLKLWKDVKDTMHPGSEMKKVRPQIEKYRVPVETNSNSGSPWIVDRIVLLSVKNETGFDLHEIAGAAKLKVLRENIYRDQIIKGLGLMEHHFRLLSQLAVQTELFHLRRPSFPLLIDELTEYFIQRVI